MRIPRKSLTAAVPLLFVAAAALQGGAIQPLWEKNYYPSSGIAASLSPVESMFQLIGFREFLAGMLWVRADGFFDEGNYDAVLPIIRLCTILDPKQIDIYSTGMWHIAYNFTDEDQRSDRRYVSSALALGKEGAKQNPTTYELFFETGWIWYHKIDDDYFQSVRWFEAANERADIMPARRNLLSNAYQRNNEMQKALDHYWQLYEEAQKRVKEDPEEYQNQQVRDTLENNIDTMLVRMVQRGWLAEKRGDLASGNYDVNPPFDVGFSARVIVEDAKVIRVQGTWNVLPVGTRIRLVLKDADRPDSKIAEMNWDGSDDVILDPDREVTFMQEQLYVKNRRFNKRIDMSKDPTMYPFSRKSKEYILEFYYNPRSGAPHIQDKFGWNGEGMTDQNFLRTDVRKNFVWEPIKKQKLGDETYTTEWNLKERDDAPARVIYTSLRLTRDQLLRRGEWMTGTGKTPIVQTKNFNPTKFTIETRGDVIDAPNIRTQTPAKPKPEIKGPGKVPYEG